MDPEANPEDWGTVNEDAFRTAPLDDCREVLDKIRHYVEEQLELEQQRQEQERQRQLELERRRQEQERQRQLEQKQSTPTPVRPLSPLADLLAPKVKQEPVATPAPTPNPQVGPVATPLEQEIQTWRELLATNPLGQDEDLQIDPTLPPDQQATLLGNRAAARIYELFNACRALKAPQCRLTVLQVPQVKIPGQGWVELDLRTASPDEMAWWQE
ncbi:MAG: hypothetical protein NZL92_12030, partial [Gloeomargarita sp. SKYG116]|nr:hypothetical protein [Gloeomargarita sp. SKYG116]MDW8402407.1 hypothetical protein [Gloeomargarita sp. SKYGB_i_bin116]